MEREEIHYKLIGLEGKLVSIGVYINMSISVDTFGILLYDVREGYWHVKQYHGKVCDAVVTFHEKDITRVKKMTIYIEHMPG